MSYPVYLPLGSERSGALATLSHPSPELWEIEMHSGKENRLDTPFIINSLMKGFDLVEKDWREQTGVPGALVITGNKSQTKFFSNGLDQASTSKDPGFFPDIFEPFILRLLGFPIPTVAAINGHAFAAGYLIAMACDYRVITSGRAWCSMNEVLIGAPHVVAMTELMNYKLPTPAIRRKTVLEGHRFTPSELAQIGMVDQVVDNPSKTDSLAVVEAAHAFAKTKAPLGKTGVFGLIRKELMRSIFDAARLDKRLVQPADQARLYSQQGRSYKL